MASYTLPTLTVTDTVVWNRLLAAFNSDPEVYKSWLKQELTDFVIQQENMKAAAVRRTEVESAVKQSIT